jgi:AcrR family transcriptional regulator
MSSEERKACIVDAACRLFSEKGFRGVTTRELASAVGVTEPVLYEHFRTKRDLYNAIIEAKAAQGFEVLQRIGEQYGSTDDDRTFFNALAESILEWYTQDPTVIRLLLYSNLEGHELKDLFHERSRDCFLVMTEYLERRMAKGRVRRVDAAIAARAFFGMIAHYALTAVIFNVSPLPKPPREVIGEMVDLFLQGLSTDEQ